MTLCVIPIVRWGKAGVAHHDVAAVIAVRATVKVTYATVLSHDLLH
jgi:hypothetical protein